MKVEEMIEVLQAFKEGKKIEQKDGKDWVAITNRGFDCFNFERYTYRIKPKPTREEITANWVKENNIEIGSKVKIIGRTIFGKDIIGQKIKVSKIDSNCILCEGCYCFNVESLEPYKEEYVPFEWADRNEFRDKWIMCKGGINEFKITFISDFGISCADWLEPVSFWSAWRDYEFIDETPFGKLKQ